jgi:hypothetical protein
MASEPNVFRPMSGNLILDAGYSYKGGTLVLSGPVLKY